MDYLRTGSIIFPQNLQQRDQLRAELDFYGIAYDHLIPTPSSAQALNIIEPERDLGVALRAAVLNHITPEAHAFLSKHWHRIRLKLFEAANQGLTSLSLMSVGELSSTLSPGSPGFDRSQKYRDDLLRSATDSGSAMLFDSLPNHQDIIVAIRKMFGLDVSGSQGNRGFEIVTINISWAERAQPFGHSGPASH